MTAQKTSRSSVSMKGDGYYSLYTRGAEHDYRATDSPQFYKTIDEYCAPLLDPDGPVYRA